MEATGGGGNGQPVAPVTPPPSIGASFGAGLMKIGSIAGSAATALGRDTQTQNEGGPAAFESQPSPGLALQAEDSESSSSDNEEGPAAVASTAAADSNLFFPSHGNALDDWSASSRPGPCT